MYCGDYTILTIEAYFPLFTRHNKPVDLNKLMA